jgi:hypothetical protein
LSSKNPPIISNKAPTKNPSQCPVSRLPDNIKFFAKNKQMKKDKKIATPPNNGVSFLCIFLKSPGESIILNFKATFLIKRVKITDKITDKQKKYI